MTPLTPPMTPNSKDSVSLKSETFSFKEDNGMTDYDDKRKQALDSVSELYAKDFAEYVQNNEEYCNIMSMLSQRFVIDNILIVDRDYTYDLGKRLRERVNLEPDLFA